MRFLADESCDFSVVKALRAAGHDVTAVAEGPLRGADDDKVIELARVDRRILLTEDKDFGQLICSRPRLPDHLPPPLPILLHHRPHLRGRAPHRLQPHLRQPLRHIGLPHRLGNRPG